MHPGVCLAKYHVELPAERYQAIVEAIIDTVARHGNLNEIGYMARYFYHCVQQHMKKNGDRYYSEGKEINNRISIFMSSLERAQRGADGTIPMLAQADALLQLGKRKAKPAGTAAARVERSEPVETTGRSAATPWSTSSRQTRRPTLN
jgi:hypothetical protein